jgi:hypothetical protein
MQPEDVPPPDQPLDANQPVSSALSAIAYVVAIPGTIMASFSLLGIVSGFVELKKGLRELIEAWQAVVAPIGRFVFGWLRGWVPDLPPHTEDYLTLGVIVGFASARGVLFAMEEINRKRAPLLYQFHEANFATNAIGSAPTREQVRYDFKRASEVVSFWKALRACGISGPDFPQRDEFNAVCAAFARGPAETALSVDRVVVMDVLLFVYDHPTFVRNMTKEYYAKIPESLDVGEVFGYFFLLPVWPITLTNFVLRVQRLSSDRMPIFLMHTLGFLVLAIVLVAGSYAFFWLP